MLMKFDLGTSCVANSACWGNTVTNSREQKKMELAQKGQEAQLGARFADSDATVTLMDDTGTNHEVKLDTGDTGNVCVMATIDQLESHGRQVRQHEQGREPQGSQRSRPVDGNRQQLRRLQCRTT